MASEKEIYNEAYNDITEKLTSTHIEVTEVYDSLDKLFDKINFYKTILSDITNHFVLDKSVKDVIMKDDTERANNLDDILIRCKSSVKEGKDAEEELHRVKLRKQETES